ncbi:hypothetical protein [Butyrivibrio sp. AE2015]|uniref:hypothetical protein n=1 Tax=Butyrivibrio sp. AE2015 TaxID=1280663 RepID=UPI0003B4ED68|nr:hypothetical protein [Butyrivibrio sp. AE2015]
MNIRKRLLPIIYIVSIAVSAVIFAFVMSKNVHDTEYTSYTRSLVTNEGIYFSENLEDFALLYRLTSKGKVKNVYNSADIDQERILALTVYDGNLYAAFSKTENEDEYQDGKHYEYCIGEFNTKLNLLRISSEFHLDEDILSSITVDNSGIYVTAISKDGGQVRVVSFSHDKMASPSERGHEIHVTENVMIRKADPERFFVSAIYENGGLTIRTDKDEPSGYFAQDERVSAAVSSMSLSAPAEFIMYRAYFIIWIAGTIIWLIIVRLVYNMLRASNRTMYSFVLLEFILAILVGCSIYYISGQYMAARKQEHVRFGIISMQALADEAGLTRFIDYGAQDYFDSDDYIQTQNALTDFLKRDGNSSVFYDVLIVRLADGMVVTSGSGRNNESAVFLFGNAISDVIDDLHNSTAMYSVCELYLGGEDGLAIGVADDDFISDYAIVGIIDDTRVNERFNKSNFFYIVLFIALFAVGSLILLGIYYLNTRDFKHLEDALRECALGRTIPDRPATVGIDLKNMWDSLFEIGKRVDEINYKRFKVFEAYFKYAPKNIEFALGKESIMDVKNGERTKIDGRLLTIQLGEGLEKDLLLSVTTALEQRQKGNDCIIVGNSTDLSRLQMLFMMSDKPMVDYAAEIIHDINMHGNVFNSAFVFFDTFEFGIVGNDGLALTYLDGDISKEFTGYVEFFNRLHLGLVITEYIYLREYEDRSVRYIGYIKCEKYTENIKLYEVMDACGQSERHAKIHTSRLFKEALETYEKKDFYLARNMFSDLLKAAPGDELSRWYLFESEKYLNNGIADEATFGALHL